MSDISLIITCYNRARKTGAVPVKPPVPSLVRDLPRQDSIQPSTSSGRLQDRGTLTAHLDDKMFATTDGVSSLFVSIADQACTGKWPLQPIRITANIRTCYRLAGSCAITFTSTQPKRYICDIYGNAERRIRKQARTSADCRRRLGQHRR